MGIRCTNIVNGKKCKGFIIITGAGSEWEETCTDCNYRKLRPNLRKDNITIDFPDRRKDA